jgi:hypothetical protein
MLLRQSLAVALAFAAFLPVVLAGVPQHTPLTDLIERAGAYVLDYEKRFSTLVAEERYIQQVKPPGPRDAGGGPAFDARDLVGGAVPTQPGEQVVTMAREKQTGAKRREMRSDVLLVQLPDKTWFGFRDVIEVDGKRVREREGRLQELFLKSGTSTKQIVDESARYNIGPVDRNSNLPTFALLYLTPELQERFSFSKTGEEQIDGVPTWRIAFVEVARPAIVKDKRGGDMPSSGHFWISPATARVLRSELIVGNATTDARSRTVVAYRMDSSLGIFVPAVMKEVYDRPPRPWDPYVECTATYSNFRRFQVTTDEKITIPK